MLDLYAMAVFLADLRGTLPTEKRIELVKDLLKVPGLVEIALKKKTLLRGSLLNIRVLRSAVSGKRGQHANRIRRRLKLKEISYKHAEGYPAGEMKHGPIALVDKDLPVVVIATRDPWYEKMISQIEQAKARSGNVLAVATEGDELIPTIADEVFWVPETPWLLSSVVNVIPLQLFAYHIAAQLGLDVDQPRNLAKSVTVE